MIVLLIGYVESPIPAQLKARVFIMEVQSEPEKLRTDIQRNFEESRNFRACFRACFADSDWPTKRSPLICCYR